MTIDRGLVISRKLLVAIDAPVVVARLLDRLLDVLPPGAVEMVPARVGKPLVLRLGDLHAAESTL